MSVYGRLPRWILPALWAAFILSMATDLGSGENTGALLDPLFAWLGFGHTASAFVHGAFRAAGHVVAYATFALLAYWAIPSNRPRRATWALLFSLALAIVDETLQGLVVPARTGDVVDVLLDGGAAACALWFAARRAVALALRESVARAP